jgi:rhodanese-related sulfurtransferase
MTSALAASMVFSASAFAGKPVGITKNMMEVKVTHHGHKVSIKRNQDNKNKVKKAFSKTSRPCPPFCIQPIKLAPGVETIGEVEMLEYLQKKENDDSILVIDSRTPDWVKKGTIAGSINIPWTKLNPAKGADPISIAEILEDQFGAKEKDDGSFDYSHAKTLVMFCNGMWCGQSPNNIKNLLKLKYPADKIKWYRGGMQDWEILGLSTVKGK